MSINFTKFYLAWRGIHSAPRALYDIAKFFSWLEPTPKLIHTNLEIVKHIHVIMLNIFIWPY